MSQTLVQQPGNSPITTTMRRSEHTPFHPPPAFQHSAPGPTAMPTRHSDLAPYFSGQVDDPIEDFLNAYEDIADSCGLSRQQKVEAVIRYIPYSHRALWKSLNGYVARNWTEFRQNLEEIYDGPSVPSRHSEQRLLDFVRESSKSCMNDEADVLQYYQDFLALSKPLLDSQRLSIYKRDKAFWLEFHPHNRSEMYARLIAKHPDQPSSAYFNYLDVYRVARVTFTGNHLLDFELGNAWDKPQSFRPDHSERARERWLNEDERDSRRADPRQHEQRCLPLPTRYTVQEPSHRRTDSQPPQPEAETKVVRFKDTTREEEDREIDDLMERMHGLSPVIDQQMSAPAHTSTSIPSSSSSLQASAPPPSSTAQSWPTAATPSISFPNADVSAFFCPHPISCAFCTAPNHRIRECLTAQEYVHTGHAIILGSPGQLHLPNGQLPPSNGTGCRIKHSIDTWLAAQPPDAKALAQQVSFAHEAPPHLPTSFNNRPPSARTEEVAEAHIVQVVDTGTTGDKADSDDEDPFDFFQVFAAEKKKRESHASKLPELKATTSTTSAMPSAAAATIPAAPIIPPPMPNASTAHAAGTSTSQNRTTPQYCYHSSAEDQQLILELGSWRMQGKLAHTSDTTPAHVLVASPAIKEDLVEKWQVQCVEVSSLEEVGVADNTAQSTSASVCTPAYSLPPHEVDVQIADRVTEARVIDPGLQIVVI